MPMGKLSEHKSGIISRRSAATMLMRLSGITFALALACFMIVRMGQGWHWEQVPLHSLIEGVGGFIALMVGFALLYSPTLSRNLPGYIWVGSALIGMGVLDLAHAIYYPGHSFVWAHTLSNFVGGMLFMLVWLPPQAARLAQSMRVPWLLVTGLLVVVGMASLFPQLVPDMTQADHFAYLARFMNVAGGFGFVLAAIRFTRSALTEGRHYAPVLANHCLLFGLSGILFEFSTLWDGVWWEWHLLRLAAYGFILYFFFIAYRNERIGYERELYMLSQAVEANGEGVMITDAAGVIEYANPAMIAMTGYSEAELVGERPSILKSDAQDPAFYGELWRTILEGRVWDGILIDRRKDGSFFPVRTAISPIRDSGGTITHYVSTHGDMTEYRKLEDQFRQAQKMESLGTLVGGIAHDFNNMLAAIEGNLYLAQKDLRQPEPFGKQLGGRLEKIHELSSKASAMVHQLLIYARKDLVQMQPLSLNIIIDSTHSLAKTLVPEDVELLCRPCDHELKINGDANQLQQLLLNLLNNACHAVEEADGPTISCSLSEQQLPAGLMEKYPHLKERRLARLAVSDNGCGISAENMEKIVEPFFTTKPVGKGTGLGLSMVYGSVERHGGAMEVESRPGEGAAFHIYLPLLDQ